MKKLLLIIAFAYTAIGQAPKCPGAYHAVGTGCYTFPEQIFNWIEASTFCQFSGGYLVNIDSDVEQFALFSYYNANLQDGTSRYIGVTDMISNGTWRWVPSGRTVVYSNWDTGHPLLSPTENCAHWDPDTNIWHSNVCCEGSANPICEADPL